MRFLFLVSVSVFVTALPAQAQFMPAGSDKELELSTISFDAFMQKRSDEFDKKDRDFNGYLSDDEFDFERKKRVRDRYLKEFKVMDQDGNRYLTMREFETFNNEQEEARKIASEKRMNDSFDRLDTDGNGHLSRDEYLAKFRKSTEQDPSPFVKFLGDLNTQYNRIDANRDGQIHEDEYVNQKDMAELMKISSVSELLRNHRGDISDLENVLIKVPKYDANGDSRISRFEHERYHEAVFRRLDNNRDDHLDANEQKLLKSYGVGRTISLRARMPVR